MFAIYLVLTWFVLGGLAAILTGRAMAICAGESPLVVELDASLAAIKSGAQREPEVQKPSSQVLTRTVSTLPRAAPGKCRWPRRESADQASG